jgi:DNA repair protein RecN (Recombination protein N)
VLTTLRIRNLALVPDLTLDLSPGYNVITGETGAGKSVIIGALNLVLGERADRSLIRSGAESCSVEAVFDISSLSKRINMLLEERGLERCEDHQLVLKRTFTIAGTNRQFINGSPATLAVLAELGEWLVDMHGPHDHQSLLHPAKQLEILDAYGELMHLRTSFAALARERVALLQQKSELIIDERSYAQQLDLLRFQVKEITSAKLVPGEEVELEAEHSRVRNAARLIELSQASLALLSEEDNSVLDQAALVGRSLHELSRLDSTTERLVDLHSQAINTLQELQRELSRYPDGIEADPVRLRELEQRLDMIQSLRRKYGASIQDIIDFGNEARQKLASLESRDEQVERLNEQLRTIEEQLWTAGKDLSDARKKIIPKFSKAAVKHLRDLGFTQS